MKISVCLFFFIEQISACLHVVRNDPEWRGKFHDWKEWEGISEERPFITPEGMRTKMHKQRVWP